MNEKQEYPSGLAALFHAKAAMITTPCPNCHRDAVFIKDDGIYEIYYCPSCGNTFEIAVR